MKPQCEEGCILELAETPFVRVGDEIDYIWLIHFIGSACGRLIQPNFLMRDQEPGLYQIRIQAGFNEMIEILAINRIDLSEELIVSIIQKP